MPAKISPNPCVDLPLPGASHPPIPNPSVHGNVTRPAHQVNRRGTEPEKRENRNGKETQTLTLTLYLVRERGNLLYCFSISFPSRFSFLVSLFSLQVMLLYQILGHHD